MSHAKQPPDAHAYSGFALITAPLPERLGWVIRVHAAIAEHDLVDGVELSIATTQPLDPT